MAIKYFVLVGIGGSYWGARAVYDALRKPGQTPELLFVDTVSPVLREQILAKIKDVPKEEILLNYVSKSGTTLEIKENFEFFREYAGTIVDTYKDLDFDKTIGGRFSVLTEVGLYPLRTCGFDTEAMLSGKADATDGNAQWLFEQLQAGMAVHDMFLFNPELESLGKWYRQLLGESTGKDDKGYVPTVSIGSSDLHAMYQRYLGGTKNIATTFVFARHRTGGQARLEGDETMHVLYESTKKTYHDYGVPYQEYQMTSVNEYELGKFMQYKIYEVIELARLMGVNAFDQPMVELYKKEARRLMGK